MLNATVEEGLEKLRLLAELVFSSGEIPKDRQESFILNFYKGKGEALDRGNYTGLKLKMVNIDDMQFRYVPRRGTTDAIFIIRQLYFRKVFGRKQTTLYCLC